MAIAFRSVGARTKADVTTSGSPQSVAMPAGHVANDLLIMAVLTDDNTNVLTTPSGWTQLFFIAAGTSTNSPYTPRPHMKLFYRIDTGALGASVSLDFETAAWPTGDPSVLAFIIAYSGCDTASPIGEWSTSTTTSTTAAQAHPQLTTTLANDWLLTIRGVSSDAPAATFTCSVGTDSERVDDTDSINQDAIALYDSNTALAAGLQTQRTTTASRTATSGSLMVSIAIRPTAAAGTTVAVPGTAEATGTAYGVTVNAMSGPWDCSTGLPVYTIAIDWNGDGDWSDSGEDVTTDILSTGVTIEYGRDQSRQLSPTKMGSAGFSLINDTRTYSPENVSSPLFGNLDPARVMKAEVVFESVTYPLAYGRIDDYNIRADQGDRTVDFTFLDGLKILDGIKLSTGVLQTQRTGDLINYILDYIGWTGGRDIDPGATIVSFWWVEGSTALTAVQEIVRSEGPPAIAYIGPDNTFIFRDRHHRLLYPTSINVQSTFAAPQLGVCDAPAVTGLSFSPPFNYAHGWRDIVNSVSFDVDQRSMDTDYSVVWSSSSQITLAIGESATIDVSTSDPFLNALTPVSGTDFTATGAGTPVVTISRTSGQSVKIAILAAGGTVTISNLQLRAKSLPVRRTIKISQVDTGSITEHGERIYPDTAPWANANDAAAIASMILLYYAQRRPTVQLRITASDPDHFSQILNRRISDRIHLINDEMGINDDFFIEQISHKIDRMNKTDLPPVHSVVFGCEKDLIVTTNPFRFDVRGAGFDEGVFDPISSDNPDTVFIFDDLDQGKFDTGLFGT
jgi:hypothetical protein